MEQVNKLLYKIDTVVAYQLLNLKLYSEQINRLRGSVKVDTELFELKWSLLDILKQQLNESRTTRSKTI